MSQESLIEVDPAMLDNFTDSDYASCGYDTDPENLTASIHEYVFANGRRYRAYYGADKNLLPIDEVEQARMDLQHESFLAVLKGALHKAPIGNSPQCILDIGTGTGIWAIEMADLYPSAEVIGTDLSPVQVTWAPPNCRFEVNDTELDWLYKKKFDFVHARNVAQAITGWSKLMAEIYNSMVPGGYVELAEFGGVPHSDDGSMAPNNGLLVYMRALSRTMEIIGRPFPTRHSLHAKLARAGFVDIKVEKYKVPAGPWPRSKRLKQVGAMQLLAGSSGYRAYGMMAFTRMLGLSEEEATKICDDALVAAMDKNNHMYVYFYVVYGRKP